MQWALLHAAVALLLFAAAAQAAPFDRYERTAVEFFGERVGCAVPEGVVAIGSADHLEYDFHLEGPLAMSGRCWMSVLWPIWSELGYRARCLVYLHEYAHMLYGDPAHELGGLWREVESRRAQASCSPRARSSRSARKR
jgi:hypothetical protein